MNTEARPSRIPTRIGRTLLGTSGTQRALIVNGSRDVLHVLEPVLDAGHYDVVFVESSTHAYSQIRRVQPDLVILCLEFDDAEGLSVLSMLKLDAETRDIPVVTYTSAGFEDAPEQDEAATAPLFVSSPTASLMN
ncbi:MAG: response regulator [Vicinamibacterales bacterium]